MDKGLETPLGRYRLIALLGQGGMADVYLACTQGPGGFQKLLVVKLARFTGDPMFSTMFLDEARLAAQLSHPNVVQTYEVGEEGSRHYIVMEYLDGANLSRLRQRASKHGGIPMRISLQMITQVLDGLDYAHQARGIDGKLLKVVHRDLTPSNIIVTAQGVVKILDFGIAKGVDTHSFTQTGRYSGKLNYMPPEQLRGERGLDARADIFSVAVILVESAIGERFWGNEAGPMVAARLGQGDLPSLDHPRLDPQLREICARALSPTREDRYPTAAALKADLVRYAHATCGLADRDEMATFVCDLIADDRERLQTVIDGQLQRISQVSFGTNVPPDLPRFQRSTTLHNEQTFKQARGATVKEVGDDDVDIVVSVDDQPPAAGSISAVGSAPSTTLTVAARSRAPLYAAIAGAAITLGVVIAISMHSPSAADATASRAVAQQAPLPPPAPATTPAVPTSSKLEVIVSPPEASLTMDGAALGTNPFVGSLTRDGKIHELVIKANGYLTLVRRFTLDQDLMLQLRLEPVPPPPPVVAVTPPPRPTAKTHAPVHVAAARPAPPPPAAAAPPVVTAPPATTEADTKRKIDGDVFDSKPSKRALDGNVYDDGKTKTSIDRDNPWK